jgi:Flp pilus assembly pilin Flp
MRKEKGQDIIEYALMLAMVVGIGFGIYSYAGSGIGNSISTVFNNAGNLLEEVGKEKLPVASTAEDIIKRLRDARDQGLADLLKDTPAKGSKPVDISSDSEEGQALSQKLNIQTPEGDGWFARINTNGFFVVSYYSAADNKGVTFSKLQSDYASNPDKYGKNSTGLYQSPIIIHEGLYDGQGKELYYNVTKGHVESGPNGSMSIYPGLT